VTVVTELIGADEYLFGPDDYVRVLSPPTRRPTTPTECFSIRVHTPVSNTTLLQPLEFALSNSSLTVETAPVTRPTRGERLRTEATGKRFAAMFGFSLAFYLILGDPLYWFDWVTGIATAAIVSVTLSRVSIDVEPGIPRTPMRLLRGVIYVPVLLFEIVKANIEVARVILDPRLPIDRADDEPDARDRRRAPADDARELDHADAGDADGSRPRQRPVRPLTDPVGP